MIPSRHIYLDYNSTWPLATEAREAMVALLTSERFGNPSSVHDEGRHARSALGQARRQVGQWLGMGDRDELIFTSGGTEGDNWAIRSAAHAARKLRGFATGGHVVSSPLEHPAVLASLERLRGEGFDTTLLPVDGFGRVALDALRRALRPDTLLVTLAAANHELGNLYPTTDYAALCTERGVFLHTDCVQRAGKDELWMATAGAHLVTVSAHKLGGPKGVGAVWLRSSPLADSLFAAMEPLVAGGHQERGRRGGTENLVGIVGFGAAAEVARERGAIWRQRQAPLRARLEEGLVALGAQLNGDPQERLWNTVNVSFEDIAGDLLMTALDLQGVCVSMGAACTSGSLRPSAVVTAIAPTRAAGAVRFSLGPGTTMGEIETVLTLLEPILARLRAVGPTP